MKFMLSIQCAIQLGIKNGIKIREGVFGVCCYKGT